MTSGVFFAPQTISTAKDTAADGSSAMASDDNWTTAATITLSNLSADIAYFLTAQVTGYFNSASTNATQIQLYDNTNGVVLGYVYVTVVNSNASIAMCGSKEFTAQTSLSVILRYRTPQAGQTISWYGFGAIAIQV